MLTDVGGTPVVQSTGGYGDGMYGGGFLWLLALLFLGGRGFGFGGYGDGAGVTNVDNTVWQSQNFARLEAGHNAIQSQLNGIGQGICDATFSLNNSLKDGFYSNAMAINETKYQLGNGICNSTFGITQAIGNLGTQLQMCCCENEKLALENRYIGAQQTCEILSANAANTQRIIDWLSCKELNDKNTKIFEQGQLLSEQRIIASMKPQAPIAAYTVPSPYGQYGFNGCCGC